MEDPGTRLEQVDDPGADIVLVRAIAEKQYLQVSHLEGLLRPAHEAPDGPATYLVLERPDELPSLSTFFTPANLPELLNSA